jgi:VIT1/CCC1 family predicted Fe2+/Mn2+ transporter
VRLVEAIQLAPDTESAVRLIQDEIEPELQELLGPEDSEALSRSILPHVARAPVAKKRLTKEDLYGGLASFWLVFVSCLPAALPFLIFSRPLFALRVSNFLLIALLFIVGYKWAKYSGTNALATGLAMVTIGLVLVGVAVLLGG